MISVSRDQLEHGIMHSINWGLDKLSEAHTKYHLVLNDGTLGIEEREKEHSLLHDVVVDIWKLLRPVVEIARAKFPTFFAILDWAIDIVKKINAALAE